MAVIVATSQNLKYGTGIKKATLVSGGTGYTAGDTLTLNAGDTNATVIVDTVNGSGVILTYHRGVVGSGYSDASAVGVTGGTGSSATFDTVVQSGVSTVGGFCQAEAYNMWFDNVASPASGAALNTLRSWGVTFANAGNIIGLTLPLYGASGTTPSLDAGLQETKGTFTVSVASPAVVTLAGHGFTGNEEVILETTGALPTGLTKSTIRYYVKYIDANTFNLSLTPGGGNINTSGTQSGTHTLWVTRAQKTLAVGDMYPETTSIYTVGQNLTATAFEFTTPYAVDTTANKWRFYATRTASSGDYISLANSDGTNYGYIAWSDTTASHSDNDVIYCKDRVYVDKSFSVKGIGATGNNTIPIGILVGTGWTLTEDGISNLVWEDLPTANHVITLDGVIEVMSYAGMQAGSSTSKRTTANRAKILFTPCTVSGGLTAIRTPYAGNTSRSYGKGSFIFYGEEPTDRKTTLAQTANTSQAHIITTDDMSAKWTVGDILAIGRSEYFAQGSLLQHTISSMSGTDITLTPNLASYKRWIGGQVINLSRHGGIEFMASADSNGYYMYTGQNPIFFNFTGCYFMNVYLGYNTIYTSTVPYKSEYTGKSYFNDNTMDVRYNLAAGLQPHAIPELGFEVKRNYCWRSIPVGSIGSYKSNVWKSGTIEIEDNIALSPYGAFAGSPITNNYDAVYKRNIWNNSLSGWAFIHVAGNVTIEDNEFFGCNATTTYGGAVQFGVCVSPRLSGNTFDLCTVAMGPYAGGVFIDAQSKNDKFGTIYANTYTLGTYNGGTSYGEIIVKSPTGTVNLETTYITDMATGVVYKITDNNDTANVDSVVLNTGYQVRCGDGLTDTTVHTSGTGKFSLRFESLSSTDRLEWTQTIPTSNIQNKTMVVNVWCKLNSANYYAGTNEMPRLTVNYDDGTTSYAEAAQTTDWQLLSLPITPTTTFGAITATLSTMTDATTTDAYVYWDDIGVLYPAGHQLNLGGMDDWADALPVMPSIATNVSAQDVWSVPTSTLTGTGTTGKKLKDGFTVADSQALL